MPVTTYCIPPWLRRKIIMVLEEYVKRTTTEKQIAARWVATSRASPPSKEAIATAIAYLIVQLRKARKAAKCQ